MQALIRQGKSHGLQMVLRAFAAEYAPTSNYARIAKAYVLFVLEKRYPVGAESAGVFLQGKPASYVSALRAFLKFVEKHGLAPIHDDRPPKIKASPWVLRFLAERQLRTGSKQTYAAALQELEQFLDRRNLGFHRAGVLEFLQHLQEKGRSAHTVNLYLSATRQFSKFCIEEKNSLGLEEQAVNQLRDVLLLRNLKTGRTIQQYAKDSLSAEEREHLMQCITRPRDKAIIALMAYQGLRTQEVLNLQWRDVRQKGERPLLAILGKGRNEKDFIPLLSPTLEALRHYHKSADAFLGESLFGLRDTSTLRRIVAFWFEEAGLMREGLSAHSLRHTTAQLLLEQGTPKAMVQRFLRHRSEVSTSVYTGRKEDEQFLNFDFNGV